MQIERRKKWERYKKGNIEEKEIYREGNIEEKDIERERKKWNGRMFSEWVIMREGFALLQGEGTKMSGLREKEREWDGLVCILVDG